jgi:hypothetical protein
MRMRRTSGSNVGVIQVLVFLLILMTSTPVSGHVPGMAHGNTDPGNAVEVEDPVKSWAYYDEIHEFGEMRFYQMYLDAGDALVVSIFVPDENGIVPSLSLWGPGYEGNQTLDEWAGNPNESPVTVAGDPDGAGSFEPFTPSVLYERLELNMDVNGSGTYYLAIFGNGGTGRFGIAIGGREEFTPQEWILVPVNVLFIRLWEGQSLLVVLAPLILVVILGIHRMAFGTLKMIDRTLRGIRRRPVLQWVISLGGLMIVGTGAMGFLQLIFSFIDLGWVDAMIIPLSLASGQVLLGRSIHLRSLDIVNEFPRKDRNTLALLGLLGLTAWAGLIIGPALVVLGSLMSLPEKYRIPSGT